MKTKSIVFPKKELKTFSIPLTIYVNNPALIEIKILEMITLAPNLFKLIDKGENYEINVDEEGEKWLETINHF